jgi:hypothetical protein
VLVGKVNEFLELIFREQGKGAASKLEAIYMMPHSSTYQLPKFVPLLA